MPAKEQLIHPRMVWSYNEGTPEAQHVLNRCYTDAVVGKKECHSYAAPGSGYVTWLVTRKDDEGAWGVKLEDTLRMLEPWDVE